MKVEYLLEKEVEQVLYLLTPENRLVLRVMLHTGLRVGDVLRLEPRHLKPHCWVTEQKTGKRRQIGLPEPLLSDLRQNAGDLWVFPGRKPKEHRTRQAVWKDVKRAAKACRLPQNVGTHSARKIYAVELLKKYGDIERVKRALNHDSEIVTMVYAMADLRLQAKYQKRRPSRGRKKA